MTLPCDCHGGLTLCNHSRHDCLGDCERAVEGPLRGEWVRPCGDCDGTGFQTESERSVA